MEKRCPYLRKEKVAGWLLVVLIGLCSGCASMQYWNPSKCIRDVELGMTKQQVTDVMGKDYKVVRMEQRGPDRVEAWGFQESEGMYVLYFLNDTFDYLEYERKPHYHKSSKKNQEQED